MKPDRSCANKSGQIHLLTTLPRENAAGGRAGQTIQRTENGWRKLVGVEPTRDTKYRTLVLKTRPSTGQD